MSTRYKVVAGILAVGAGMTCFATYMSMLLTRANGREPMLLHLLALNGSFWLGWAVLSLPIVALSEHVRIDRRMWKRPAAIHFVAMVIFCAAHIALTTSAAVATSRRVMEQRAAEGRPYTPVIWSTEYRLSFFRFLDWELLGYAAIAGLSHAVFFSREAHRRELRGAQLEKHLVEAQLQTLQRQLQPHFLFNTLHAISALMHRDVDAADRMLTRLSDLLRMTLDPVRRQQLTLKDEIDFLRKYLQIEQTRLGERLTVSWEVDGETLDCLVPNLVLQPLVENAIKHGIALKSEGGALSVRARRQGGMLLMEVEDDGSGPSETGLASLQKGIGLSNTRARLSHHYGANYRFEFHKRVGSFAVVIALPWKVEAPQPQSHSRVA
ncbi:MAG: histidine kinase [Acidobacteriota bacterium]|nr:histidine kinase [Acidobacteriota bacterium]